MKLVGTFEGFHQGFGPRDVDLWYTVGAVFDTRHRWLCAGTYGVGDDGKIYALVYPVSNDDHEGNRHASKARWWDVSANAIVDNRPSYDNLCPEGCGRERHRGSCGVTHDET